MKTTWAKQNPLNPNSSSPAVQLRVRRARALTHLHLRRAGLRVALALALVSPALHAQTAGSLDPSFAPNVTGGYVSTTVVQPDGKILLAGRFSAVNGQARNSIARLLADGTVEGTVTFNPGTGANFWTLVTAVQSDGKILIGGPFTTVNGQTRNHIARLLANGTVESTATFNPGTGLTSPIQNNAATRVALQTDGKILITGQFTSVNGQARRGIARLNSNGSLESTATFNPGTGANTGVAGFDATVSDVAVQADGKILIVGDFTSVNGQARRGIARLVANGTVESTATFNIGTGVSGGFGSTTQVGTLALQADGRILIAGDFTTVNGQPRNMFARLLPNGEVESTVTFNPGSGTTGIRSMALQADGKILLGGQKGIVRLHADGAAESADTFNTDATAGASVFGVALQADGKILLGGSFTSIDGQPRNRLARLSNDVATQSLIIPDATRVLWLRGGAAPEVEQVTFELSINGGANWSLLGSGTRITGGWELTGLGLPDSGSIRSRGRTIGGALVESVAVFPVLPALSIEQSNAQVVVSWPFPSTGFVLQQNTSLDATGWTPPFETVIDNATTRLIRVTSAPGSRFFRLFRP